MSDTKNDTLENIDRQCKSIVYDYLNRKNLSKIANHLLENYGPFDKNIDITLENVVEDANLKKSSKKVEVTEAELVHEYLTRNGFTKVAEGLSKLFGPFDEKIQVTLESVANDKSLKRKREESIETIETNHLVYEYLQRNGHSKISRKFVKLTNLETRNFRETEIRLEDVFKSEWNIKQRRIPNSEDLQLEKDYDELVLLTDVFKNDIKNFRPESDSHMDKVLNYILKSQVVKAPYVTLAFSYNYVRLTEYQVKFPKIRIGKFTNVEGGENQTILKYWDVLVKDSQVSNPLALHQEIKKLIKTRVLAEKWKLMVIGSYLCQGLFPKLRHPKDVIMHTIERLVYPQFKKGRFGTEEDDLILEKINQNGNNKNSLMELQDILKRPFTSVKRRASILLSKGSSRQGRWTLAENQLLINHLFPEKDSKTVNHILGIGLEKIRESNASKVLNRLESNIHRHWESYLKSILLRYHYGNLHMAWKPLFMKYLIENEIVAPQDINYKELAKICPGIVRGIVDAFVQGMKGRCGSEKDLPINIIAKRYLSIYQNRPDCGKQEQIFRESIIDFYDKDRSLQ